MIGPIPIERNRTRDEVKHALVDPIAVCAALGIDEGAKRQGGGLSIRCPAHGEKNPSCSVTVGADGTLRVRCFACGLAGDVFNLVAAARGWDVRRDFARVLTEAAQLAHVEMPTRTTPAAPEKPAVDYAALWDALDAVDSDGWEYLRGRGLDGAADHCRTLTERSPGELAWLGKSGYVLAVALRDAHGAVVAIQARKLGSHEFRIAGKSSDGLFGDPARVLVSDLVVLAEGLSDALAAQIATAGDPSIAVIGIAGTQATAALSTLTLAGKRVAVATDADPAGDAVAADLDAALLRLGAKPYRCRPTQGKDLCDMLAAGVDLAAFLRSTPTVAGFQSVAVRLRGEREERLAQRDRCMKFGVKFLDAALGGIFPRDLVLLGAKTGVGKTALATIIAQANVLAGKRVHYFALEAEDREIERRMKYNQLAEHVYQFGDRENAYRRLNYLDWYAGRLDDLTAKYEERVDVVLGEGFKNLHTFYRVKEFGGDDLDRALHSLRESTDLAVVDHIHYLDLPAGQDDQRAHRQIVRRIRNAVLELNKPIVIIAHLRKADKKAAQVVPVIEDFHGTSDVPKIVTKAIMIAPDHEHSTGQPHLWNTYINPVKCRQDGSRTRYAAMVAFNAKVGAYEQNYALGRVSANGDSFTLLDEKDYPEWSR